MMRLRCFSTFCFVLAIIVPIRSRAQTPDKQTTKQSSPADAPANGVSDLPTALTHSTEEQRRATDALAKASDALSKVLESFCKDSSAMTRYSAQFEESVKELRISVASLSKAAGAVSQGSAALGTLGQKMDTASTAMQNGANGIVTATTELQNAGTILTNSSTTVAATTLSLEKSASAITAWVSDQRSENAFFNKGFWQGVVMLLIGIWPAWLAGITATGAWERWVARPARDREHTERRQQFQQALAAALQENVRSVTQMVSELDTGIPTYSVDIEMLDATATIKYDLLGDLGLCGQIDRAHSELRHLGRKIDLLMQMWVLHWPGDKITAQVANTRVVAEKSIQYCKDVLAGMEIPEEEKAPAEIAGKGAKLKK